MAAPKLAGNSLSFVAQIITTKNAGLVVLPSPREDSSETVSFDVIGVTKNIKILGWFIGIENDLAAKKIIFEALATGTQDTSVSFVSNVGGKIQVKILDMTFTEDEGRPNRLNYEINLAESE